MGGDVWPSLFYFARLKFYTFSREPELRVSKRGEDQLAARPLARPLHPHTSQGEASSYSQTRRPEPKYLVEK